MPLYKRVLLKISGEAFLKGQDFGVNHEAIREVVEKIRILHDNGIEIGIVMGGGNIFRGIRQGPSLGLERIAADQIGMLATLFNGIVLQNTLKQAGCEARIMSAFDCPDIAERYHWQRSMDWLKEGKIILFAGGTGHPYFTTDTAAALRASEIKADILLKATTRVDAIYDSDPLHNRQAKKYETISYEEVLEKKLGILDLTAVTLCMTNRIPIRVFNLYKGSLLDALTDGPFGTLVK